MIPFEVRTNVCDGLATVAVAGDLDCATAPRLRATLEGMAPGQNVVVDLSGTDFLDCAGVGVLLSSQRRTRSTSMTCRRANILTSAGSRRGRCRPAPPFRRP